MLLYPLREGLVAGLRRAPKSFTGLNYYNQLVLEWRVPHGNHYLVRFRLVPTSDIAVSDKDKGLTDLEDLKSLWNQSRRPGEPRSKDYLRQRLYDRLTDGDPVTYELQAQFHAPQREDSLEWYDASLEWDERTHPWQPLGELILDRLLTSAKSDGLRFDPRNSPPSLKPPRGSSISDLIDPRTLATAQYRVNSILGRIRLLRRPSQGLLHTAAEEPASQASAADD
jgi:catalase